MKRLLSLPVILITYQLYAQLPPTCPGGSPSVSCDEACINCNFNDYFGSTTGFPSGVVPNFCGTVENAQWLGFIAGATQATFSVTPSNCSNGDGVQVALYQDCQGQPLGCEIGKADGGNITVDISVSITPGQNYFLMIDGYAGDQCDFKVSVSPDSAVYQPKLDLVGDIEGAAALCPGSTFEYSVDPVIGAGGYVWTLPSGARIDTSGGAVFSASNKVNIQFGNTGGVLCVQAVNACAANPPCTGSMNIQLLPDSEKPDFYTDSVAHLACTDVPIGLDIDIEPIAHYDFRWTASNGSGLINPGNALRPKISETGIYTLHARNTENGCADSVQIRVAEPELPSQALFRVKDVTCFGLHDGYFRVDSVQNGSAPYLYELDGMGLVTSPEFRYLYPGEHKLRIQASDGCEWDSSFTIVQPNELILELGLDSTIALGNMVNLFQQWQINEPERMNYYQVDPPALYTLICDTCQFQPMQSFKYKLWVRDSNGCEAFDERTINISRDFRVFIPNAFAPLSAQGNERFSIYGGPELKIIKEFFVYNRWGNLVYEQRDFEPNQENSGWDGRQKGQLADPGVFVWKAKVAYINGEEEVLGGSVTLVR